MTHPEPPDEAEELTNQQLEHVAYVMWERGADAAMRARVTAELRGEQPPDFAVDSRFGDDTDPFILEHPETHDRLAVRVDGEWLTDAAEYGPIAVFWNDDGVEIGIHEDGAAFSHKSERHQQITELDCFLDEGGVESYIAPKRLPISEVEVHDVSKSKAHESFTKGRPDP